MDTNKRYHELAAKREQGKLTKKEYAEWLKLVNESFSKNAAKALNACLNGFLK